MKSKLLITLALLAALAAGFFLGRWQVTRSVDAYIAKLTTPEVRRATAGFSISAGLLKAIRSGDTNEAIETLEADLDTQIMYIGAVAEATPAAARDRQWLSRIRWLQDYRAAHPRKTDQPFIDEQVAHVLSLLQTNQ